MNALLQLDEGGRKAGVVTHSSGNHAQAVALAGELLGVPVCVVMPRTAPAPSARRPRATAPASSPASRPSPPGKRRSPT